jgi:cellobiose-specific phosphotransferase system component IIC
MALAFSLSVVAVIASQGNAFAHVILTLLWGFVVHGPSTLSPITSPIYAAGEARATVTPVVRATTGSKDNSVVSMDVTVMDFVVRFQPHGLPFVIVSLGPLAWRVNCTQDARL